MMPLSFRRILFIFYDVCLDRLYRSSKTKRDGCNTLVLLGVYKKPTSFKWVARNGTTQYLTLRENCSQVCINKVVV